jgi:hypothetical protein
MAITTMDSIVAGLQPPQPITKNSFTGQGAGFLHSAFYLSGLPGAAAAPSPGLAGAALTSYAGQLPVPTPAGSQTIYLAGLDFTQAGNIGGVMLCDRLWHNSGITVTTTTAQTVNSVAFPARDMNGATAGVGVQLALEVGTVTGNGSPITNTTVSYTNSAGTSGKTASITSVPATAAAGTFVPFTLAAGDVGVQSIQSITLGTSYVSGAVFLVAYRTLAWIPTPTVNIVGSQDFAQLGFPNMFTTPVPWLVYVLTGTAGGTVYGTANYAMG